MIDSRDPDQRRAAGAADLQATGARNAPIEIVAYDPMWPERFVAEAARLHQLVPRLAWHHIGSTAVPGLAAKPVIDMMALAGDLDAPISDLINAGYSFPTAYNAALHGRRWLCRPSAEHRTHHLHLVAEPAELDRHLRFRNALRADTKLAEEYAELKRTLAARAPEDREGYTAAKTAFVRRVENDV